MAIEKFTWNNGTESNPVPLTKTQMVKLITAANDGNIDMDVSGHFSAAGNVSIESSIIQSLNHLFDNKLVYHGTTMADRFSLNISSDTLYEGNRILISSTGIDLQFLQFACVFYDADIVVDAGSPAQISKETIKSRFNFNNGELVNVGGVKYAVLNIAPAQENAEWSANFYILAAPKYDLQGNEIDVNDMVTLFKNSETGDYRVAGQDLDGVGTPTVFQGLAIAMTSVTIPDSISMSLGGQASITKTPVPSTTTKASLATYTYTIGSPAVVTTITAGGTTYIKGLAAGTSTVQLLPVLFGEALTQSNTMNVSVIQYSSVTIRIDQNYSNPTVAEATVANPCMVLNPEDCGISNSSDENNVITWIRRNSHRYLGKFVGGSTGMLLRQLDDRDSRYFKYEGEIASAPSSYTALINGTPTSDGNTADAQDGVVCDVFMALPKFYYKTVNEKDASNNETGVVAISFARGNLDGNYIEWPGYAPDTVNNPTTENCVLIGVHEGTVLYNSTFVGNVSAYNTANSVTLNGSNTTLHSVSGQTPTNNFSQGNFKGAARSRNDNSSLESSENHFSAVTYDAHKIMALLFYGYYGGRTLNCQSIVGYGTSSYPKVAGGTDSNGMTDTYLENNGSISFWGLENWWGDLSEWVDDLITADSNGLVNLRNYNNTANLRQIQSIPVTSTTCVSKYIFGEYADMLPAAVSGTDYGTHFCDGCFVSASSGVVARRGHRGSVANGGVGYLNLNYGSSNTDAHYGSRLVYSGKVTMVDSFE